MQEYSLESGLNVNLDSEQRVRGRSWVPEQGLAIEEPRRLDVDRERHPRVYSGHGSVEDEAELGLAQRISLRIELSFVDTSEASDCHSWY